MAIQPTRCTCPVRSGPVRSGPVRSGPVRSYPKLKVKVASPIASDAYRKKILVTEFGVEDSKHL